MHLIESISIKGFWGNHAVQINKIHEEFNFLIGPNGSGKSTILKLIAGVILADKEYLSRLDFTHIRIGLKAPGSKKKPCIEVTKRTDSPYFMCDYQIFESASEKPHAYVLSEMDGNDHLGRISYWLKNPHISKDLPTKTLSSHLSEMISLVWLSVHRTTKLDNVEYADPLDIKLEDLSNRLVRHLSSLSKKVNHLYERFQEQIFLSLLDKRGDNKFSIPDEKELEIEKNALSQIFSEFKVDKRNYQKKLNTHFSTLDSVRAKIKKDVPLDFSEITALLSLHRIESMVEFWEKVTHDKRDVLESRDRFIEILNGFFQRKTVFIDERNEIFIKTDSGKILTPNQLSSGEKQLLIILGEALLQEGKTYIYMADEPEISLHVAWQEVLAKNIKSLNPAAQIIFATHSPDVVGAEHERIIFMEQCIK